MAIIFQLKFFMPIHTKPSSPYGFFFLLKMLWFPPFIILSCNLSVLVFLFIVTLFVSWTCLCYTIYAYLLFVSFFKSLSFIPSFFSFFFYVFFLILFFIFFSCSASLCFCSFFGVLVISPRNFSVRSFFFFSLLFLHAGLFFSFFCFSSLDV